MASGFFKKIVSFTCTAFLFTLGVSLQNGMALSLHCQDVPRVFDIYLKNHYAYHRLTEDIKNHTIEQFIKEINPSKTLLLEEDVTRLRKDLKTVFKNMQAGNCSSLSGISDLIISRAESDQQFAKGYLGKDYQLDESVELIVNPDKRGYAKSEKERQELLKKMIHFQISNDLTGGVKIEEAKKQLIHRYELVTKRLKEKKPEDMLVNYLEAFATALDPHSSFMSQDSLEDFQIQMRLSLEGIGASLISQDGFTEVVELIAGGSAERSKALLPKDKIIAVAEAGSAPVSVIDMDLREVVKLIRGKKGTKVTLTVLRQGEKAETFRVTLVRDKIDIKEQAASITYEDHTIKNKPYKVGVIDLPSFYGDEARGGRSSSEDVRKLLEEAKKKKVAGIVLDLSRNGGGLLSEAVKISGLFLKKANIVATKDFSGQVQLLSSEDNEITYSGPLVVLTSKLSASASEILAGALKDYRRAIIIGNGHTFGKGSVQALSGLPLQLGAVKITTGMFFLPKGESTQYKGVVSDIQLPSAFSDDSIGEKFMDYSLPPQSIPEFISQNANSDKPTQHWDPVPDSAIQSLSAKSVQRINQDPEFDKLKKEIAENLKNKDVVRLSDLRKKEEAEKKKEKKLLGKSKLQKKMKDISSPLLHESVNILLDWVSA